MSELEDGQQGRECGQHGERGQAEAVAERPAGVVQERQRDEERDEKRFQPDIHGGCRSATVRSGVRANYISRRRRRWRRPVTR